MRLYIYRCLYLAIFALPAIAHGETCTEYKLDNHGKAWYLDKPSAVVGDWPKTTTTWGNCGGGVTTDKGSGFNPVNQKCKVDRVVDQPSLSTSQCKVSAASYEFSCSFTTRLVEQGAEDILIPAGWAAYSNTSGTYPLEGGGFASPIGTPGSAPPMVCKNGRQYSLLTSGDYFLDVDSQNKNGFKQVLISGNYQKSCNPCSLETDLSANSPPPTCTGTMGEINGVQRCYLDESGGGGSGTGGGDTGTGGGDTGTGGGDTGTGGGDTGTGGGDTGTGGGDTGTGGGDTGTGGGDTGTGGGDTGTGSEDGQQSECEKHPNTIGCAEFGSADGEPGPASVLAVSRQSSPWSFGGGGSCPAPVVLTLGFGDVTAIDFAVACDLLSGPVRAIVLFLASISALFVVFPKSE